MHKHLHYTLVILALGITTACVSTAANNLSLSTVPRATTTVLPTRCEN